MAGNKSRLRIQLQDEATRKRISFWGQDFDIELPVFLPLEDVEGTVYVTLGKKRKMEFTGLKLELIGKIEIKEKAGISEFLCVSRDLTYPGVMTSDVAFPFSFAKVEKLFETYYGTYASVRYLLRACMNRNYHKKITTELEFAVIVPSSRQLDSPSVRLEVGIEDCLHIEFEFIRNTFSISDCLVGKVFFLLVNLPVRKMEIVIVRKETITVGTGQQVESETMGRYEVMDGEPVRGECVPIRMFLSSYPLSPTYEDVNHRFNVRYYASLVIYDDSDRKYFKQQEIVLYRDN